MTASSDLAIRLLGMGMWPHGVGTETASGEKSRSRTSRTPPAAPARWTLLRHPSLAATLCRPQPMRALPPAPSYALTPHWLGLYPQDPSQRVSTCSPLPWHCFHSPHAHVLTVKITTVLPNSQHSVPLGAHSKGQEYTSAGDSSHKD